MVLSILLATRRSRSDCGLDPNEIESSVLKDTSAVAVYGLDANGALLSQQRDKQIKSPLLLQVLWASARRQGSTDRDMLIVHQPSSGDTSVAVDMVRKMREVSTDGKIPIEILISIGQTGVRQHHIFSIGGSERFVSSHLSVIWKKEIDKFKYVK